jgi:hypothetical protein
MSSEILDGEDIVQARIRGESVRSIAKRLSCTLAEVHKVLDRFAETTIDEKTRKHTLALELARLDELQTVFHDRALAGDVHCGALVAKIIERRCTMLGLYTPPAATLQVIEAEAPKETSTDRICAAIDRIRGKRLPRPDGSDELPKSEPDDPDKLN